MHEEGVLFKGPGLPQSGFMHLTKPAGLPVRCRQRSDEGKGREDGSGHEVGVLRLHDLLGIEALP